MKATTRDTSARPVFKTNFSNFFSFFEVKRLKKIFYLKGGIKMDLSEIPRVPLIFGLLILALVAGVAGYSYFNNDSSQQIAAPAPVNDSEQPLTDQQMQQNLENPTADMNASDVDLDSESVDSGTVSDQGTTHTTHKKAVSAVAVKKPKTTHPSKPAQPQNPANPTNPTNPTNSTEPAEDSEYTDEPWDPLEPPVVNPDDPGDYGGDDDPEGDNGGQGDLMP